MPITTVLLDRDGVINRDRPDCVHDWSELELLPGALDAIAALGAGGLRLSVVTNQSCVGRGWVTDETLDAMHAELKRRAPPLEQFFVCRHRPDAGCACRKPRPGLLEQALSELECAAERAVFVGDSVTDLEAARSAGIPSLLVLTGKGQKSATQLEARGLEPLAVLADLEAAARWILKS